MPCGEETKGWAAQTRIETVSHSGGQGPGQTLGNLIEFPKHHRREKALLM